MDTAPTLKILRVGAVLLGILFFLEGIFFSVRRGRGNVINASP
jgi:hypothetical protein